jgi:hypothetical protein
MTPVSRQRTEELERELPRLTKSLSGAHLDSPKTRQRGRQRKKMGESNAPPPEAVCRVLLHEAKLKKQDHKVLGSCYTRVASSRSIDSVSEREKEPLDWPQEWLIEGKLIFPPSAPWDDSAIASTNTRRRRKVEEAETTEKMVLGVIVTAVVHGNDDSLLVECEDMKIEFSEAKQGDPMTDSWLPRDDILKDIQRMLSDRLSAGISGLTDDLRVSAIRRI